MGETMILLNHLLSIQLELSLNHLHHRRRNHQPKVRRKRSQHLKLLTTPPHQPRKKRIESRLLELWILNQIAHNCSSTTNQYQKIWKEGSYSSSKCYRFQQQINTEDLTLTQICFARFAFSVSNYPKNSVIHITLCENHILFYLTYLLSSRHTLIYK